MRFVTEERPTILVIDDSDEVRDLITLVLKDEFDLKAASNGREGLEKYMQEKPDLVLTDIDMPEMDGYEVCRRIKAMTSNTFVPIIFITSKNDLEWMKEGLKIGAEDYLTKPFEPEELLARVRAVLRTKKLYNQLQEAYTLIDRERDIIADIQRSLLCAHPPRIDGFQFFFDYQPSSKAGGDYYDFIEVDGDHLGVLVSDVSGHGTPAAVIMAMLRVLLRSSFAQILSPRETLNKINRFLCGTLGMGYFITCFYGIIHLPSRRMKYSSAGHNPPIVIDYDSGQVRTLSTSRGFPLMISPQNVLEERELQLLPNSKLILYTDGLTETRDRSGKMFGSQRLENLLLELGKNRNAQELGKKIKDTVQQFAQSTTFEDDYTLVILEVESGLGK